MPVLKMVLFVTVFPHRKTSLSHTLCLIWHKTVGSMGAFVDGGSGHGDDGAAPQEDPFDVNHITFGFYFSIKYFLEEKNAMFAFLLLF